MNDEGASVASLISSFGIYHEAQKFYAFLIEFIFSPSFVSMTVAFVIFLFRPSTPYSLAYNSLSFCKLLFLS